MFRYGVTVTRCQNLLADASPPQVLLPALVAVDHLREGPPYTPGCYRITRQAALRQFSKAVLVAAL